MRIIKSLLFYPLLWLRGLFIRVGKVFSAIFLISTVLLIVFKSMDQLKDIAWVQVVIPAALGFGIFMLMEFYDQILLKLNPTGAELTLYK